MIGTARCICTPRDWGSLILLGVEVQEPEESLLVVEAPPRAVAPLDEPVVCLQWTS